MSILSKTSSVLDHDPNEDADEAVLFSNINAIAEDEGDPTRFRTVIIHQRVWEELGRPEQVTVTVEPGNTLE